MRSHLPPGVDGWGYSLKGLMGLVCIGGLLITLTYFMLQRAVVPKYDSQPPICPAFPACQQSSASTQTSQRLTTKCKGQQFVTIRCNPHKSAFALQP